MDLNDAILSMELLGTHSLFIQMMKRMKWQLYINVMMVIMDY